MSQSVTITSATAREILFPLPKDKLFVFQKAVNMVQCDYLLKLELATPYSLKNITKQKLAEGKLETLGRPTKYNTRQDQHEAKLLWTQTERQTSDRKA